MSVQANLFLSRTTATVDDRGNVIADRPDIESMVEMAWVGVFPQNAKEWRFESAIAVPPPGGNLIPHLEGKASVRILAEARELKVPDILQAKERVEPLNTESQLLIHSVLPSGANYTMLAQLSDVTRHFELGEDLALGFTLEDARGRSLPSRALRIIDQDKGEFAIDFDGSDAKATTLRWAIPIRRIVYAIPYEFRNLPLP